MVTKHHHKISPVTITFSDQVVPGIFLLGFKRKFEFIAGQVIGLSLKENGPRRLYSICSGEQDPEIHILFNVVEEGYLSPRLSELESGEIIWITEPRGEFISDHLEQFLFFDEFNSLLGNRYIRCCTAEEADKVYTGRVTEYLEKQPSLNPELKYYICGRAEIVVDTRDILIRKGVPFDHILSEIYF